MKVSEIQGEAALDTLAELLEPVANIMADDVLTKLIGSGQKLKAVQHILKSHKKDAVKILALLDGEDPETYNINLLTLPRKLLEVMNDKDLVELFQSQGLTETSSGSATENTEVEKR